MKNAFFLFLDSRFYLSSCFSFSWGFLTRVSLFVSSFYCYQLLTAGKTEQAAYFLLSRPFLLRRPRLR